MKRPHTRNHDRELEQIPLFSCLPVEELHRLGQAITEKCYPKNTMILMEDDSKNYMYVIFSGKIKVVRMTPDGKEQILVIRKKGDFFGELTLLDGKSQPASIVAMEDAAVGLISKKDFDVYLMKNENVLRKIIIMLCERLRESWMMLRLLSLTDAESKLRAVLTLISSIYGVRDLRGIIIPLKLTHREIADYAALTRETVSRLLKRFSRSGEIQILENKSILLTPLFVEYHHHH